MHRLLSLGLGLGLVTFSGRQSLLVRSYRPLQKEGQRRSSIETLQRGVTVFDALPFQVLLLKEGQLFRRRLLLRGHRA